MPRIYMRGPVTGDGLRDAGASGNPGGRASFFGRDVTLCGIGRPKALQPCGEFHSEMEGADPASSAVSKGSQPLSTPRSGSPVPAEVASLTSDFWHHFPSPTLEAS